MADYGSKDLAKDIVKKRSSNPKDPTEQLSYAEMMARKRAMGPRTPAFKGPQDSSLPRKSPRFKPWPRSAGTPDNVVGEPSYSQGARRGRNDKNQVQKGKGELNKNKSLPRADSGVVPPQPYPGKPGEYYGWPTSAKSNSVNRKNKAV